MTLSTGMSRAAADHCAEQIGGQLGHDGMLNAPARSWPKTSTCSELNAAATTLRRNFVQDWLD